MIITSNVTSQFIAEHGMALLWTTSGMIGPGFCRIVRKVDAANSSIEVDAPTRYPLKMRDNADQSGEIGQDLFHQFKSCTLASVFKDEVALLICKFKVHHRINTFLDDP